jgi:hypothetical protein
MSTCYKTKVHMHTSSCRCVHSNKHECSPSIAFLHAGFAAVFVASGIALLANRVLASLASCIVELADVHAANCEQAIDVAGCACYAVAEASIVAAG